MFWNLALVVVEVVIITVLDYAVVNSPVSLDVFYCLPVIQAARLGSIQAMRRTDSQIPLYFAIFTGVTWSVAEAMMHPDFPLSAFLLNAFSRSVTFTVLARVVARLWKEREYGISDHLTKLNNRAEFMQRFEVEQLRSERTGKPYSAMFVDIDNFKALNDRFGHDAGDKALKRLANVLRQNSRKIDILARIGGDEFVLLFPETEHDSCTTVSDRIRKDAHMEFEKHGWPISVSIGCVSETGRNRNIEEILREADQIMYTAKIAHKNSAPQ
ncbi:MAG: GGDEF domain-containing protein [Nitrosomonadales bacterium]|nr:GGDEF domain-containing protein [Nitrosomonadales bacterium]